MKPFRVFLTEDAAKDLEGLFSYLADRDSPAAAERILDGIAKVLERLGEFPDRGRHPRELAALGNVDYRETVFKPYRLIYRIIGNDVYVYLIADARRDMQSLLARRLLGG